MNRVKIIILCCVIFIVSCKKETEEPIPLQTSIFSQTESIVNNGQEITFDIQKEGVYTLVLLDKETGDVISRDKFYGVVGNNKMKFYTKSIPIQYLYLLLEDSYGNEIGKTIITIQ